MRWLLKIMRKPIFFNTFFLFFLLVDVMGLLCGEKMLTQAVDYPITMNVFS